MNLLKLNKLFPALVAAIALAAPVSIQPAAAAAHTEESHHSHERTFWVYYRQCPQSPWVCYGGYYEAGQARQAVNYFSATGYEAFMRAR
jgi:hypothetical protein